MLGVSNLQDKKICHKYLQNTVETGQKGLEVAVIRWTRGQITIKYSTEPVAGSLVSNTSSRELSQLSYQQKPHHHVPSLGPGMLLATLSFKVPL